MNFAITCNAYDAGFYIKPTKLGVHPDTELSRDECTDLHLSRPDTDYSEIYDNSLFFVNGLIHPASAGRSGITLKGAYYPKHPDNQVSLLRFNGGQPLQTFPITETLIESSRKDVPFREHVYFDLQKPLRGHMVFMVIAGRMYIRETTLTVTGESTVRLDIQNLDLPEIIMRTYRRYGPRLEKMGLHDEQKINRSRLLTDEGIKQFLIKTDSFIGIMSVSGYSVEKEPLESTGLPGKYWLPNLTTKPILFENGELAHVTLRQAGNRYLAETQSIIMQDSIADTTDKFRSDWTVDRAASNRTRYARAWLLDFKTSALIDS